MSRVYREFRVPSAVLLREQAIYGGGFEHAPTLRRMMVEQGMDLAGRIDLAMDYLTAEVIVTQPISPREIIFRDFSGVKFVSRQNPLLFRRF